MRRRFPYGKDAATGRAWPPVTLPIVGEQNGTRIIAGRTFDFARQVAVMAIVNRTPDSFHDRGSTFALERALAAVDRAAAGGADWIAIGGGPFPPRPPGAPARGGAPGRPGGEGGPP